MYKVVIAGHGNFSSGVVSALQFLMGENENLSFIQLSEESTHRQFEEKLINFLKEHPQVIIFADLTGGAPHQIAARVILENQYSNEHFLISGMPLSVIVDLSMKFQFLEIKAEKAAFVIEQSIQESKEMIQYLSLDMVKL
jgi:PTS system N-acetylgalactosamine-specific IIA component